MLRSALLLSVVLATLIVAASATAPRALAQPVGPAINLVSPSVVQPGSDFTVTIETTGAPTPAYAGFQLVVAYDSTLVTPTAFVDKSVAAGLFGAVSCSPPTFGDTLIGTLALPLEAATLGCTARSTPGPSQTSDTGALAAVTFHAGASTGKATIFLIATGWVPTYTFAPDYSIQANTITCNGVTCVPCAPWTSSCSAVQIRGDSQLSLGGQYPALDTGADVAVVATPTFDAFDAYRLTLVYNGDVVSAVRYTDESVASGFWASDHCDSPVLNSSLDGALAPPLLGATVTCRTTSGAPDRLASGPLGAFTFVSGQPGTTPIHLLAPGAPDNGGAAGTALRSAVDGSTQDSLAPCPQRVSATPPFCAHDLTFTITNSYALTIAGGGNVRLGSRFDATLSASWAFAIPPLGYHVALVYDSRELHADAFHDLLGSSGIWPGSNCGTPALDSDLGGMLAPPLKAVAVACGATSFPLRSWGGGTFARVTFTAHRAGSTPIHVVTEYLPDNGGALFGAAFKEAATGYFLPFNVVCGGPLCGRVPGFAFAQPNDLIVNAQPACGRAWRGLDDDHRCVQPRDGDAPRLDR